jgi:hypothetical protein
MQTLSKYQWNFPQKQIHNSEIEPPRTLNSQHSLEEERQGNYFDCSAPLPGKGFILSWTSRWHPRGTYTRTSRWHPRGTLLLLCEPLTWGIPGLSCVLNSVSVKKVRAINRLWRVKPEGDALRLWLTLSVGHRPSLGPPVLGTACVPLRTSRDTGTPGPHSRPHWGHWLEGWNSS